MANQISRGDELLAFTSSALQRSVALLNTVNRYKNPPKAVRELKEELEELNEVLEIFSDTINTNDTADFTDLIITLQRCGNACREFEESIIDYSNKVCDRKMSLQDWAKLRYIGEDIHGFRHMVAGYKSTIRIVVTHVNLRTYSVTANVMENYKELIKNATSDLKAYLKLIDKKLEAIVSVDAESLCTDVKEIKSMKEEQLSSTSQRETRQRDSRVKSSASMLWMTDEMLQDIIRCSSQGWLREAEALSQNPHLEQLNQFTNKELYGDSAKNNGSSSSDWQVEESKLDAIMLAEKATGVGNASIPTDPIHEVGDCLSDISKPPSVFSLATMPSTTFTTDTRLTADQIRTAIDELVCIFLEDAEIDYLFREAILKRDIASDRLDRNFRRLMKRFATNLKDEAQEAIDLDLANLILSRVTLVAEKIGTKFRQESSALETFPQGSPQMHGTVEVAFDLVPDIHDVSSGEENDQEKPGIDDRFARLVSHGRSFIEESAAFQKLRVEFKNFLMPTVKPILLDFSFNSKEWMIRCFWSLESLLSRIGPREESDSPYPISTRPSAVSPPREIVLFSEPIDRNTNIYTPERPSSWHISRSIGCLGLSFNINHLLWAVRISWDPQKLFSSFGLQNLNPLPQHQIVLLCQPCRQSEPHFESSTLFTWECAGVESNVDRRKVRGRISWDPAELLRSLYLRERKVPKHHKRFRWTNRYGKRLYDDYIEREPGALQALQDYLAVTTVPKKTITPSDHGQSSSRAASLYTPNVQSTQTTSPLTTADIADQSVTNSGNSESSTVLHDIEQPTKPTRPLLLLACIKRHGRPVKLHQEFVTHIADDRQLFHTLRKIYYNHRQRLESFWSLRTLHSIHFMRTSAAMAKFAPPIIPAPVSRPSTLSHPSAHLINVILFPQGNLHQSDQN
ncbi:hypothetical protein ABOM_007284 [Aspergillus bombycis]|uniref:Azaphilone pigments biosynthesis cluster protein L N-terminal domain-containing protein n=1 Tax=Aspergillus bombycis TaxID=109264 RepID=A0A1F7ZXA3_9EURO|nr:hypothetical protein ABOM_007284 [Aspergillus bombycis]OGM44111.1 hypothetical protein ABOM_007284 [Aspergillus bombycis]